MKQYFNAGGKGKDRSYAWLARVVCYHQTHCNIWYHQVLSVELIYASIGKYKTDDKCHNQLGCNKKTIDCYMLYVMANLALTCL